MSLARLVVFVEVREGVVAPTSLEVVSRARDLADLVDAVVVGAALGNAPTQAAEHGATAVITCEDARLSATLLGPPAASVLQGVVSSSPCDGVLLAATYTGRDAAGRLAVAMNAPVLSNVVGLDEAGGRLRMESTIFGATQIVHSLAQAGRTPIVLVRPKSFPAKPGYGDAITNSVALPDGAIDRVQVVERRVEASTGPKLEDAPVVVSGGRGLGEAGNFALLEQLASLVRGSVGASRAVVDAGWVPYAMQVGQTGKTVKPMVYIACGISGAMQHTVGMKGAKNIIAINKDEDAPIFRLADLGVVGDCLKILPQVIQGIQARN